jgi:hypothetical protein
MTNIWTNSFDEVRKPYFDMEDPYTSLQEKKEGKEVKKWWDDDGDGKGYEEGEVSGKFKKKKVKEEVEEIDENRMASRMGKMPSAPAKVGKATHSIKDLVPSKPPSPEERTKARKALGLGEGMHKDAETGEVVSKAVPGKTYYPAQPMKKTSVAKAKETQKEETLYTSKSSQQKIDVRKGIKNKIDTKPTTAEEVETWVAELVSEGYDLSEFTWDEMTDIYLDEAGSSAMPPRGDYQTTTATATQKQDPNAPLIAAKAKAAKAKVTKEIADLQVAKQSQRMKVDTNESVIHYLANRPDPFENLEEGVFDPKKSKMRSAEARSQRTMTSAQRAAAKKEGERTAKIHSKGETVLAGLTKPQKKSSQPMGSTQPSKPAAPAANRKVTGKYDQLAKKASAILKSAQDK